MPAAAPAASPAAPATDVPRHVADLSDIQRCADSKKDDVMDRTSVNTQSWIAFRFQFYMALITRCNIPHRHRRCDFIDTRFVTSCTPAMWSSRPLCDPISAPFVTPCTPAL